MCGLQLKTFEMFGLSYCGILCCVHAMPTKWTLMSLLVFTISLNAFIHSRSYSYSQNHTHSECMYYIKVNLKGNIFWLLFFQCNIFPSFLLKTNFSNFPIIRHTMSVHLLLTIFQVHLPKVSIWILKSTLRLFLQFIQNQASRWSQNCWEPNRKPF